MKLKQVIFLIGCIVSGLILITSCRPSIPNKYLQKDEMEDILYDYHIADAMSIDSQESGATMIAYKTAILKKHGVTEAEFDSSMVYYMRHTRLLEGIYTSLADRINKEAVAKGATNNDGFSFDATSSNGDTINIWNGNRTLVLNTYSPFNVETFNIPVDTTFHKGDIFLLNFDTQFIFQDGTRDAIGMLAVKFSNDSVATQNVKMAYPSHFSVRIENRNNLGIKEVKGYFLLNNAHYATDTYSTTFKLMILTNISLIKMRGKQEIMKAVIDSATSKKVELSRPTIDTVRMKQNDRVIEKIPQNLQVKTRN